MDLNEIRGQLDITDQKISALYEERLKLCEKIAEFKIENHKEVLDRKREEEKLKAVRESASTEFNAEALEELYKQIMTVSRRCQYIRMGEKGIRPEMGFSPVEKLPAPKRVVYQGVEGAYSQMAAEAFFRESPEAEIAHVPFFEDAVKEAESGKADYAVVPIENSSAGAVTDTYDLLMKHDVAVAGEYFLPVRHALLGLPGAELSDIRTVYSHAQGLMQCSTFLSAHRNWQQISMANTAVAARKVMEDRDRSQAAIASTLAGKLYSLSVLQENISENEKNTTRFVVLTGRKIYRKDAGKISLIFELPHRSGSLYNLLGNFIFNHINMTKIESRPIPDRSFEYRFFADIDGNLSEPAVLNAIAGIRAEAAAVRILGNY